ncbi:MAG: hypothetical protein ACK4UO_04600 [Pseudolabrys sp.]
MAFYSQSAIALLWLAWALYWAAAAFGAKQTTRHESVASRLSHLVPILLGGLCFGVRGIGGPWLERPLLDAGAGGAVLSVALVAAGLGFAA